MQGVGKSTFCRCVSERTGIARFTASALIKTESELALTDGSKRVSNPSKNQEILVRAVKKHIGPSSRKVILDGHFTLLNPAGEIEPISLKVFEELELDIILILHDKPELICERLIQRDGQTWPVTLVRVHQDSEIEYAGIVASHLGVPLHVLTTLDMNKVTQVTDLIQNAPPHS